MVYVGTVGHRTLVAEHSVGVLLHPCDALLRRIAGGRQEQVWVMCRVGGKRRSLISHGLFAGMARAGEANGRSAPSLDATCHDHRGLAGGNQGGPKAHRVQPRAALGVHAQCGALHGQACGQRHHACRVATGSQGVAHHHGVYRQRADARARQQGLHHGGCQLVGAQHAKGAVLGHHGAARPCGNQRRGCRHGVDGLGGGWMNWVSRRPKAGWSVLPLGVSGQGSQLKKRLGTL